MDIISDIRALKCGDVIEDVDIKEYTTYHVGGHAICLVEPRDIDGLISLLKYVRTNQIKHKIIGNGSNLIFDDKHYDGVLIKLTKFSDLEMIGPRIVVGAGYSLMRLALKASRQGLTGLEFAAGIPGSVGGSVFMNAGAYKSDMGYVVRAVKVLTPDYEVKTLYNHELDFHYRTSFFQKNPNYICLEVTILLRYGTPSLIMEVINDRKERRVLSQPLEYPSAGSVFRNPKDDYAGRLIEEIGYKGKNIGGAKVSEKHANFIVNTGDAKGEEVKALIHEIQEEVKKKYGIELKVEQEFVE